MNHYEKQEGKSSHLPKGSIRQGRASVAQTSHAGTTLAGRRAIRGRRSGNQKRNQGRPQITPAMVTQAIVNGLILFVIWFAFMAAVGFVFKH